LGSEEGKRDGGKERGGEWAKGRGGEGVRE